MRRSQAPSLRYTSQEPSKPSQNANIEQDKASISMRSTETVIDILFGNPLPLEDEIKVTDRVEETNDCRPLPKVPNQPLGKHSTLKIFNIVYGKQTKKKHKTWEGDGTLEIGENVITLKDEMGKALGTVKSSKYKDINEGSRLLIGSKEVEVIDLAENQQPNIASTSVPQPDKRSASPLKIIPKRPKLGKNLIVPLRDLSNSENCLILPEPNATHQWYYNKEGLAVTPVQVDGFLAKKLRQHQKVGLTFLYECVMGLKENSITGAILADEMGLGKTLQCIALVWTLLRKGPYGNKPSVRQVLIVTPSSLTRNWESEFVKWLGRERLKVFVVDQKTKVSGFKKSNAVMIISYETFLRYYEDVTKYNFDLLICDEGHRLKNNNIRTTQLLQQLPCERRILLTGTPIQNDLQEFFALVNFVNPNALGSLNEFRRMFEEPIVQSRQPFADDECRAIGEEKTTELNRKTSLFMLRRTHEVLDRYLPAKHEVVVFCKSTTTQKEVYNTIISSLSSKLNVVGLMDGPAHLSAICALKKICNHPALILKQGEDDLEDDPSPWGVSTECFGSDSALAIHHSAKLTVTANILTSMVKDKIVLVSSSTQTLDMLADLCQQLHLPSCRLDGSTPQAQRASIVERFNCGYGSERVFLLSAKAGGVGLNLTGASRLILFDSDWNPATDLQAMSRIWRDGQKHSVYIYRLLTSGTIEEKIYQRQLNKQGLYDGTVDPSNKRSIKLSKEEIKELFAECEVIEHGCATHSLLCICAGDGHVPGGDEEEHHSEEGRSCQLSVQGSSSTEGPLKMNELLFWQHHGPPFDNQLMTDLLLTTSHDLVSFIFKNSTI